MKNRRTKGILWLLIGNLLLVAAFSLNVYWSNFTLRDSNEFSAAYDTTLRAIYVLAFLIALFGLLPILKDHPTTSGKVIKLIFPIVLFLLPAFIFILQVLQLVMTLVK